MNDEAISAICFAAGGVICLAIIVFFAIGFPLAQIWAINTIFETNIGYNLKTWLAMIVLNTFFIRFTPPKL